MDEIQMKNWIKAFYIKKGFDTIFQAVQYSERLLQKVTLADLVLIAILVSVLIFGHFQFIGTVFAFICFFIVHTILFSLSGEKRKQYWEKTVLTSKNIETEIDNALLSIAELQDTEKKALQKLIESIESKDNDAFKMNLEEALNFEGVKKLDLIKKIQQM